MQKLYENHLNFDKIDDVFQFVELCYIKLSVQVDKLNINSILAFTSSLVAFTKAHNNNILEAN